MKLELQALREKFSKQKSVTVELYESLDNLEPYSRKNSLEIHGLPEGLHTSADVVIKLSELLLTCLSEAKILTSHIKFTMVKVNQAI